MTPSLILIVWATIAVLALAIALIRAGVTWFVSMFTEPVNDSIQECPNCGLTDADHVPNGTRECVACHRRWNNK